MAVSLPSLLTTTDLARIFRVRRKTIREWSAQGKLRSMRVGRGLRFSPREVERLLAAEQPPNEHARIGMGRTT